MNIHERLEAFFSGERPDEIPYTIYYNEYKNALGDPAWTDLLKSGLGITYHFNAFTTNEDKTIEHSYKSYKENGKNLTRHDIKTPVGHIYEYWEEGWKQKYLIENEKDYEVMLYIANNTQVKPSYQAFLENEQKIKPYGIALSCTGRTPMQRILVDFVGLEHFAYHLYDYKDQIEDLYKAFLKNYEDIVDIVANGPGRFVSVLENFTAETMGPARFGKYHIPIYNRLYPIMQDKGKIVGNHYDGRLSSCAELIRDSKIDLIESLTPPNEGDMTLKECRKIWPDKLFWSNIKVSDYELSPKQLKNRVLDLVEQGSDNGKRLAFEVSESIPVNWKESMPIVLEALKETRK